MSSRSGSKLRMTPSSASWIWYAFGGLNLSHIIKTCLIGSHQVCQPYDWTDWTNCTITQPLPFCSYGFIITAFNIDFLFHPAATSLFCCVNFKLPLWWIHKGHPYLYHPPVCLITGAETLQFFIQTSALPRCFTLQSATRISMTTFKKIKVKSL